MIRSTTNGVMKSYRYNLQSNTNRLNSARDTVLTGRNFNSFAEDPTTAARAFQLRSTLQRTEAQHSVGQSVVSKYEVAWSTLDSVISDVNNAKGNSAFTAILNGSNDTTGSGRTALGQELTQLAGSIVQAMNARYGDNFVFAGADGLNIPLTMDEHGNVSYRGIDVTNGDIATLDYLVDAEKKYADLGLGLQEDENGHVIDSSAFNVALHGISYLGYGQDEDGDPKNIVSLIYRMGELLSNCDSASGNFEDGEEGEAEFRRLAAKFELSAANLTDMHTQMDARAAFLKSNQKQLETNMYTLQEQIVGMEDVDTAEAITSYSWAQYCYNAALKVGNSILSQSLMDYLNS